MDTSPSSAVMASDLIHACLDGNVPVAAGSVHALARTCGWMVSLAAATLAVSNQPRELLGAVLIMALADADRAGYTPPPASPPGEPNPVATAVWLIEREAAGAHELVDAVLTTFLSIDPPGRAVLLAQVTAHVLALVDGSGAHAMLRGQCLSAN
jgi:hypothetical protein